MIPYIRRTCEWINGSFYRRGCSCTINTTYVGMLPSMSLFFPPSQGESTIAVCATTVSDLYLESHDELMFFLLFLLFSVLEWC